MAGEITGESIKSAIALKLKSSFATSIETSPLTIYKEKMVQNMKKPCFFIWPIDVASVKLMRNNYEITSQMLIKFFPKEDDVHAYMTAHQVGIDLLEHLATIEVAGKPVVGKQMSFKIVDEVLQMFVTYKVKARTQLPAIPDMQTLELNDFMKEE